MVLYHKYFSNSLVIVKIIKILLIIYNRKNFNLGDEKMKIEKLILKNFAAVKNAMNANTLEIDFSQSQNKICLLIGPNGSGKTTILSMLHPFSDLGNLDIRNTNKLILENKDGYKEIQIRKNDDLYIIKHFYTAHKGKNHSVKSYIELNGKSLNVNGNVSSFKEIVKEELQIEPDYLKLIRLGSNVTSLIDLSSTERKNFMSKIMDDIGVFLNYYKNINLKLRQLNEMISHNVDKLKRLDITNKEEYQEEINNEEKALHQVEDEYQVYSNRKAIYKEKIHQLTQDKSSDDYEMLLRDDKKKLKRMQRVVDKMNTLESTDSNYYQDKINELEKALVKIESEISNNEQLIHSNLDFLNTQTEQLHLYQIQLTKEKESDKEVKRMSENIKSMRKRLREYEEIIGDFKPTIEKEELERFSRFLLAQNQFFHTIYNFGKPPVEKVIDLMIDKENVMQYINAHLMDLDNRQTDDRNTLFMNMLATKMQTEDETVKNCLQQCVAKDIYYQIKSLLENMEVNDKTETVEFYKNMEYVYSNLKAVLPKFKDYKEIIELLPEDIKKDFEMSTMYDHIKNLQPIYNEKNLNNLLSLTTEYTNYQNLKEDYQKEKDLRFKFASVNKDGDLESMIESIQNDISDRREKISQYKSKNIQLLEKKDQSQLLLANCKDTKEALEEYEITKENITRYEDILDNIHTLSSSISKLSNDMDVLNQHIIKERKLIEDKKIHLSQYKVLEKELEKMNTIYDELTLAKRALSSKEGMPLHIIGRYLNNTEDITNELLNIAYDGKIYIDKFEITANEFAIPFFNNGVRLDDVKFASQGELSFLSIALSFALSSQALSHYNIMLLDEIDGPLDTRNREKFIKILENQIDRIHSEQNFLITHNAMFNSYGVDILDLSFKKTHEDYPLAHYIDIKRE